MNDETNIVKGELEDLIRRSEAKKQRWR